MKLVIVGFLFVLVSCGGEEEDPALVEKYEKQKAEITALEKELSAVRKKIEETEIPDPSSDLRELKAEITKTTKERRDLEFQIKELEKKKVEAAESLEKYKEKYPIRSK